MSSHSIEDCLSVDHDQIHVLFQVLLEGLKVGGDSTEGMLDSLEQRLEVHMVWEEEALFPQIREGCSPLERRSMESLEIDHQRIRESRESRKVFRRNKPV